MTAELIRTAPRRQAATSPDRGPGGGAPEQLGPASPAMDALALHALDRVLSTDSPAFIESSVQEPGQ